eukprot:1188133-Prorocentrum_minimum.AAC.4
MSTVDVNGKIAKKAPTSRFQTKRTTKLTTLGATTFSSLLKKVLALDAVDPFVKGSSEGSCAGWGARRRERGRNMLRSTAHLGAGDLVARVVCSSCLERCWRQALLGQASRDMQVVRERQRGARGERRARACGEVDVTGCVDNVDALVLPLAGGGSGGDGDAALLLLDHPVHGGTALVHLADLVGAASVVEDALCGGGLASVNVCLGWPKHDAHLKLARIADRHAFDSRLKNQRVLMNVWVFGEKLDLKRPAGEDSVVSAMVRGWSGCITYHDTDVAVVRQVELAGLAVIIVNGAHTQGGAAGRGAGGLAHGVDGLQASCERTLEIANASVWSTVPGDLYPQEGISLDIARPVSATKLRYVNNPPGLDPQGHETSSWSTARVDLPWCCRASGQRRRARRSSWRTGARPRAWQSEARIQLGAVIFSQLRMHRSIAWTA